MSWVGDALAGLREGKHVAVRPRGFSMRGRINDGQLVTLAPSDGQDVSLDDIVFVRWKRNFILHIVKEVNGLQLLIGNNVGKINGWVERSDVLGRVVEIHESD